MDIFMNIYDFKVLSIDGNIVSLKNYRDRVLLIVNVASECKFTVQYKDLQELHSKYNKFGLSILAFPSNQFLSQEPKENCDIKEFSKNSFDVEFDMFSKIEVNGKNTNPIYKYIKNEARGVFGSTAIKWNFTKFLIDKDGKVLERYSPSTNPKDIEEKIKILLGI
jgi:glutathione peroxidase